MWLSGCSGCHMSFLDLDERLVDLVKLIDILFSPIVDTKVKDMPQVDVAIVEGCVNNTDQEHELKMLRDRCKILIAIGDCAITGNIPALRNQFTVERLSAARLRTGREHQD
jgi:NAD-reducing hydrogenase small subunit